VQAPLRNRWFDFTSVTTSTGTISVPLDAPDYDYLVNAVVATTGYSGSSLCVTIDAIQGAAGSVSEFCSSLEQPWSDVVNLCVPGHETSSTLALLRTLNLAPYSHAKVTIGINDMAQGRDPNVSLANTIAILDILAAAGIFVIINEEHPQGSMDSTRQTFLRVYNTGLRNAVANRGSVVLVPVYSLINDPATDTGSATDLVDGTHWTAIGADKIARKAAELIRPYIKLRPYSATSLSTDNYITNGAMAGSSGTHTSAGSTAGLPQGQVASSWTVNTPGANVTCTARKISGVPKIWRANTTYALGDIVLPTYRTGLHYVCTTAGTAGTAAPTWNTVPWASTSDNAAAWLGILPLPNLESRSDWQYLQGTVGGTVTTQERITFQQTVTLASVGLVAGDWVRLSMRVHALDSNWRSIMLALRPGATIDSLFSFTADGGKSSFITPASQVYSNKTGIMRTPWWKIPAGQTSLLAYLEGGLGTGSENSIIRVLMSEARIEKRA
jgi:lysophospholipase L1-like esterase